MAEFVLRTLHAGVIWCWCLSVYWCGDGDGLSTGVVMVSVCGHDVELQSCVNVAVLFILFRIVSDWMFVARFNSSSSGGGSPRAVISVALPLSPYGDGVLAHLSPPVSALSTARPAWAPL